MKKILGLDLGVTSIGWALISENENNKEILAMGTRIVPLSTNDKDEFSSGNKISKNQMRTQKRTQRKGYNRYQGRRQTLKDELIKHSMYDETLFSLKPLELWGLRAKAAGDLLRPNEKLDTAKLTLSELGRIFYHLNQKRGYKSARTEKNQDKKDTEYVTDVKNRYKEIQEVGITIGQKFYYELRKNENYRIKQQVYPREAYIKEFEAIYNQQQKHYPNILTDEFKNHLRDDVIYYQRRLKSQKGLVNVCEFEGFWIKVNNNKELFVGPKVAPRSSPLFQICKLWESINTICLKNKKGEELQIPIEKKREIFEYLDTHERLTQADLFTILELKKEEGWYGNKMIAKGIQGNITKTELIKILGEDSPLLHFQIEIQELDEETYLVDRKTGEIVETRKKKIVYNFIDQEPLYRLWHTIYSLSDLDECKLTLIKKFGLDDGKADQLAKIDFRGAAFGNKSVKAMKKILPYLMEGYMYSEACSFAGYNHSKSFIKEEIQKKHLFDNIPLLSKNSLRQPVVEKILNQMINLVNEILDENRAWITREERLNNQFEIRVELARELKQSIEERNEAYKTLSQRERENEIIRKSLQDEYSIRATRNNVVKWRLYHEINEGESKTNAMCIYCGKQFGFADALNGDNVDVEHIIPKSLLFDDSQSNKTLSHRSCNEEKSNRTAFDYMQSKGVVQLQEYIDRIASLYKRKIIGRAKRDKLLMPASKIPDDFIERQLRETQYISKKAKEILEQICINVWSTSGSVTAYLRRIWGWDDVLMNLQLPKYRELGLTEWVEWETSDGQKHKKEIIKNWSKRDDHRHHAVDALTIACTQQGFIQRINTLSSEETRKEMFTETEQLSKSFKDKLSLLDRYLITKKPFDTSYVEEHAQSILISCKAGKKVATWGKRKVKKGGKKVVVQSQGIIVPRGALSEESVYGKIKIIDRDLKTNRVIQYPVKYLFEHPHLIFKEYIRTLVVERLALHEHDVKKALASLKKEPIYLDKEKTKILIYGSCFKEEYVMKYPLESIKTKDTNYIIDNAVRVRVQERLFQNKNKEKEAFKEPLYINSEKKIAIKTVRLLTGLSAVEPLKLDESGKQIGFVKPGNNHHIAFYIDENGKKHEHGCTLWHAVERKKYSVPIIIESPNEIWNRILSNPDAYPEPFQQKLPNDQWIFSMSLQQNELFILDMEEREYVKAIDKNDKKVLSRFLYRLRSIAFDPQIDLYFEHHLETRKIMNKDTKKSKRFIQVKSMGAFDSHNPHKVRINYLGEILK